MTVEIAQLIIMIPLLSASIVAIIGAIQNSKCSILKCCWGCVSCVRNVDNVEESSNVEESGIELTPTAAI